MRHILVVTAFTIAAHVSSGAGQTADPETQSAPVRAARSVHLFYPAPEAVLFYNEVMVEQSQTGSYFMACGFSHGYFGIQQRANDRVVIFSVWDPGDQNNPDAVEQDRRVQVLYAGENVDIARFGGEGTGARSLFEYDWKENQRYRFCVSAQTEGDRTIYAAYFFMEQTGRWKHLATYSTITGGAFLKGFYSFVEDFRRDVKSAREIRRAQFGNGWVKTVAGDWVSLTRARFTADSNPLQNIDAGVITNGFFLQTGGPTQNNTPLRTLLQRLPEAVTLPEPLQK